MIYNHLQRYDLSGKTAIVEWWLQWYRVLYCFFHPSTESFPLPNRYAVSEKSLKREGK